jgi:phenylacetate-coenzyme A ligase PaaK-like adenylate-forming protein
MSMHRWLVWNVFFPLHERVKGHPTFRILKEMEAADFLTFPEIEQLRALKLQRFLQYAYANVPYVRRVMEQGGLAPSDIQGPSDLIRLPLMRKADVRKNREEMRSRLSGKLTSFSTGGSTGEPLLFDLPQERIASWIACRQRAMRWWGLSAGDKEYAIWGSPVEVTRQDRLRNLRDMLLATRLLSAFEMSESVMSHYLDLLERGDCRTIFAYPSSIYLLCQYAQKTGRNLRRAGIRTVFVTGEILYPHQRELIADTLNCPVGNGYGGRDSGFVCHECPQGGMHIMADATIVEILDPQGQPVPAGESGEIVVTDLHSREVPFLRYATGDIGALSSRRCPCGRPLPLLENIQGRTTDFIVAPDGTILHALSVIYILREIDGIEQFKIRQKEVDRFHVQLVRNQRYKIESESLIREGLQKRLRSPIQVTIEYVATLPPERSGKFRHVISDVPLETTARGEHTAPVVSQPMFRS